MASLRGTVTEQNLKNAFAWESQAISRYLYFAKKADAEGFDDVVAVFRSVAASKTRTRIAISNISGERAISRPVSRSAGLATTLRPRSLARHTNTPTSIRAWHAPLARRASTGSPTGSRRTPRPGSRMRVASKRRSMRFDVNGSIRTGRWRQTWTQRRTKKRASAQSCTGRQTPA